MLTLFDDVLQCAIPTYFFSFSMFFILVAIGLPLKLEFKFAIVFCSII